MLQRRIARRLQQLQAVVPLRRQAARATLLLLPAGLREAVTRHLHHSGCKLAIMEAGLAPALKPLHLLLQLTTTTTWYRLLSPFQRWMHPHRTPRLNPACHPAAMVIAEVERAAALAAALVVGGCLRAVAAAVTAAAPPLRPVDTREAAVARLGEGQRRLLQAACVATVVLLALPVGLHQASLATINMEENGEIALAVATATVAAAAAAVPIRMHGGEPPV